MVIVMFKRNVKILALLYSTFSFFENKPQRPELGILEVEFIFLLNTFTKRKKKKKVVTRKYSILLGMIHDLKF